MEAATRLFAVVNEAARSPPGSVLHHNAQRLLRRNAEGIAVRDDIRMLQFLQHIHLGERVFEVFGGEVAWKALQYR